MGKKVVIVHTGPATVQPLQLAQQEVFRDREIEFVNLVDDSLLKDVMKVGEMTKEVRQRMAQYFVIAERMGADAILNACSSVGEAADYASEIVNVPVVKIDNTMTEKAVELGERIGVLATVYTTLEPSVRLIERKAAQQGKSIQVEKYLCSEAFEAVLNGDGDKHDQLLIEAAGEMATRNDVLVLCQVSMARLAPRLTHIEVPVLTSPISGMQALKQTVG